MSQTYCIEFKEEACKRVQSGVPAAQVARGLGVNVNTLYTWMSRFREHPTEPFVGSGFRFRKAVIMHGGNVPKACAVWRMKLS